jgi:hypothetical protein
MRSEELRVSVAYPEGVLAGTVSKHYGLSSEMFSGSLFFNWYEDVGSVRFSSFCKKKYFLFSLYLISYLCTYDLYCPVPNAFDAGSIHYESKWEGFPGPNPLPLAQVIDAARIKSFTHRAI